MVCAHCAAPVTEEIERISGVTAARLDVDSGRAVVISDGTLDVTGVRAAVDEAGYALST
ncbi:heavy-metal-associated domain-containing protein [Streptomyces carpinensis]|uniref:Heavy-metal-associated domain-containing protein n=2 Tax=Streptomyces carpinensis TaxID=66369 RepID=A0ABV1WD28_9ACTN|nr:heavy-metal-associated domain-containing protein [Streptomyces carpinensis]